MIALDVNTVRLLKIWNYIGYRGQGLPKGYVLFDQFLLIFYYLTLFYD